MGVILPQPTTKRTHKNSIQIRVTGHSRGALIYLSRNATTNIAIHNTLNKRYLVNENTKRLSDSQSHICYTWNQKLFKTKLGFK